MKRLIIDLYSLTHEFYRTRDSASAKPLAEGICILSILLLLMNGANAFRLVSKVELPFLLGSRLQIIACGLALFAVGTLAMKSFVRRDRILRSPENLRMHAQSLKFGRKARVLALVVSNFALLIILAELVHG